MDNLRGGVTMCRIGVFYGSSTGNTQEVAEAIAKGIEAAGGTAEIKNVSKAFPEELLKYDGIAIGSSTWGNGDFQHDFDFFYEMMEGLDLTGKKAIPFGSCDPLYERFGNAVDQIHDRLCQLGAELISEPIKIIKTPTVEDKKRCFAIGEQLVQSL